MRLEQITNKYKTLENAKKERNRNREQYISLIRQEISYNMLKNKPYDNLLKEYSLIIGGNYEK